MNRTPRRLLFGGATLVSCAIAGLAATQPMPQATPVGAPPPSPTVGPAHDLQRLQETHGIVQRFTLTPRGDLDGFVLTDGTDVHLPPHLSTQLAAAVRPGDSVSVRGYRSATVPLVVAADVTDPATNQTVADQGPPPPGFGPPPLPPGVPAPGAQQTSLTGRVETSLYGTAGDLNGAVLEDGTIVRVSPPTACQLTNILVPGQPVAVQGWGLNTSYGRVVDAQAIGLASGQPTPAAPPPIGARPPQPPRRP